MGKDPSLFSRCTTDRIINLYKTDEALDSIFGKQKEGQVLVSTLKK